MNDSAPTKSACIFVKDGKLQQLRPSVNVFEAIFSAAAPGYLQGGAVLAAALASPR